VSPSKAWLFWVFKPAANYTGSFLFGSDCPLDKSDTELDLLFLAWFISPFGCELLLISVLIFDKSEIKLELLYSMVDRTECVLWMFRF